MSKEYYKKKIIGLRADIAREGAATLMQLARFEGTVLYFLKQG